MSHGEWLALIGMALGVFGHVLTAAWYFGRLSQRVNDVAKQVEKHESTLGDHETRLSRLEGARQRENAYEYQSK